MKGVFMKKFLTIEFSTVACCYSLERGLAEQIMVLAQQEASKLAPNDQFRVARRTYEHIDRPEEETQEERDNYRLRSFALSSESTDLNLPQFTEHFTEAMHGLKGAKIIKIVTGDVVDLLQQELGKNSLGRQINFTLLRINNRDELVATPSL